MSRNEAIVQAMLRQVKQPSAQLEDVLSKLDRLVALRAITPHSQQEIKNAELLRRTLTQIDTVLSSTPGWESFRRRCDETLGLSHSVPTGPKPGSGR